MGEKSKKSSLAGLLEKQIEAGKAEAMVMDSRMDISKRYLDSVAPENKTTSNRNFNNRNYNNQGNSPKYQQPATGGLVNQNLKNLNWQQQDLMQMEPEYNGNGNSRRNNIISDNRGIQQGSEGNRNDYSNHPRQPRHNFDHSNNNHANRFNHHRNGPLSRNYNNMHGGAGNHDSHNPRASNSNRFTDVPNLLRNEDMRHQQEQEGKAYPQPIKKMTNHLPEWADDIADDYGNDNSKKSSLNWQQQALVNRDESDPFLSMARGESEYVRE